MTASFTGERIAGEDPHRIPLPGWAMKRRAAGNSAVGRDGMESKIKEASKAQNLARDGASELEAQGVQGRWQWDWPEGIV